MSYKQCMVCQDYSLEEAEACRNCQKPFPKHAELESAVSDSIATAAPGGQEDVGDLLCEEGKEGQEGR